MSQHCHRPVIGHKHFVCVLQGQDKEQGAPYIQNYTKLAAGVFQLAAWTYGESPSTEASGGADENNSNNANSGFSQHILPPSLAALALQKGPAGALLLSCCQQPAAGPQP